MSFFTPTLRTCCLLALVPLTLAGCEIPGMGPDPRVLQKQAEAKAIGGSCRHALRGLEDCFTLNPRSAKSSVFEGWREMDEYMRANKIEGTPSVLGNAKPPAREKSRAGDDAADTES